MPGNETRVPMWRRTNESWKADRRIPCNRPARECGMVERAQREVKFVPVSFRWRKHSAVRERPSFVQSLSNCLRNFVELLRPDSQTTTRRLLPG